VVEVAAERNSTLVMPIPVELLRFFDKMTPPQPAGEPKSAADSASMADFGDVAVAEAEADAEIGGAAADPIAIPEVPKIPALSPVEKGDVGTAPGTTSAPAAQEAEPEA
jgi:hypothetical protein